MHRCFKFFFGTSFFAGLCYLFSCDFSHTLKNFAETLNYFGWIYLDDLVNTPLFFSEDGMRMAALITIRVHTAVLAFMALLQTTSMPELLQALNQLHIPRKLIVLLHFTYRYVHVLGEEALKIQHGMILRGFAPSLNLSTFRTYGNLIGMLLIRSIMRSQRVYDAMILRGFNGSFPFSVRQVKLSRPDVVRIVILFALLMGCLVV